MKSQRAQICRTLGKFQSLDDTSVSQQELYEHYEESDRYNDQNFTEWSASLSNNYSSLSQSLRGHNLAARDMPKSGSNHMQPIECSFVELQYNQVALLHMIDQAIDTHVKVCASEASPAKTKVSIGRALVDHATNVKVRTIYSDSEECEKGGEPLHAHISCPDGTKIAGSVEDHNNGKYDISFTPNSPGTHILSLNIQNTPIGHSPYEIYVSPVCPLKCTAIANPSMVDYAGLAKVTARDTNGERCTFGGDQVDADLRDPHGAQVPCSIDDNKNGTYHVTFNPTMAGLHALKVTIHNEDIQDNPVEVPVRAISAKFAKVKIKRARVGRPSHVKLQAIDHNGRRLKHGGDLIRAQLYNERDEVQPCTVRDNHNGTYTITYTPRVPGEYLLGISIYKWSVSSDKPFVVCVPEREPGVIQDVLDKWYDLTDWIDEKFKGDSTLVPAATSSWSQDKVPKGEEVRGCPIC